ncbi:phage anti-repressor protein [Paraburkholderia sp. GAS199]|uniref:antA/AntB antirepressor family protein n=1 Tax=Paraburkholderia sp. GAS199 TaxID=3035126 RepID=UPI003D213830
MNQLIPLSEHQVGLDRIKTVSGRDLHKFLLVGTDFTDWIKKRIVDFGFTYNVDFTTLFLRLEEGGDGRTHYHLSLDMTKELAMVERNDKGREARKYFIECERRLPVEPSPADHVMSSLEVAALIGRFRLVQNHSVCVSCFNRGKEVEHGLNSKGDKPVKWATMKPATVTILLNGKRQKLSIGLRSSRPECERFVARVYPGATLLTVIIGAEAIWLGAPEHKNFRAGSACKPRLPMQDQSRPILANDLGVEGKARQLYRCGAAMPTINALVPIEKTFS